LPVAVALFVLRSAANVPIYDEWVWSPLVVAAHTGTLTWADLWAQQNSHRTVVPTLIALGLAALDGWDTRIEGLASVVLAALVQFGLLALIVRRFGAERGLRPFWVASLLVFSLVQSENFIWGFQLSWFVVDVAVLGLVLALTGFPGGARGGVRFAAAVLCALAASLSMIFGFAAWIAGFVMLLQARARERTLLLALWTVAAAVCSAVFLAGYHRPADEHGWFLEDPAPWRDVPQFALAVLGTPLGLWGGRWVCELLGVAVCVAFAVAARRAHRNGEEIAPWTGLFAFAAGFAVMTAIGRTAYGLDNALVSRYATPSSLAWIAAAMLGFERLRSSRVLAAACAACFVAANVAGTIVSWQIGGEERSIANRIRYIDTASDAELRRSYTDNYSLDQPGFIRRQVADLRRLHLGPFDAASIGNAGPPPAPEPSPVLPQPLIVPEVQPRILGVAFDRSSYAWGDLMHIHVVTTTNTAVVEVTPLANLPFTGPIRLHETVYGAFAGLVRIPFAPPLVRLPVLPFEVRITALGGEGKTATRVVTFELRSPN
jgi:MFS family permease